jgi:4-amino-4-deoxy-L-arabinose transferase-like glycosyltransferase
MPGSAEFVQRSVHALEAGALAVWIKRGLVALVIIAVAIVYLWHFRGLATAQAMDQAQIGRAIATGHGWHTNVIRPRAVGQLAAHGKNISQRIYYDTYHAPLPPLVDAIALFPIKSHLKMTPANVVYAGDKAIAVMSILLFFASVVVLFFIARRLFDQRLALLACGLVLLCDALWQYSLSGLPQMLLLFLFNVTVYGLARAIAARNSGGFVGVWLAAAGAGFGLLALTHALTIWMFAAALVFCVFYFRPRGWAAAIVLATFAIIYTPWLLRNFIVCGNPGGVAIYSVLDGMRYSEAGWMRHVDLDLAGVGPGALRDRIATNLLVQTGRVFGYLGWSVVALMFFAGLLHAYKRHETSALRWMILTMWGGAVIGMAVYGINEEQGVAANQLHLIFVPVMTCFGLAFLLVQWNRLDIDFRLARLGFLTLLYFLCALPMIFAMPWLARWKPSVRWPPYVPPYIAVLNGWMKPDEIVASDMPWAVAWYADRRSLWVPDTLRTLTEFNDYNVLGGPVNGLYLTPVSGSQNTLGDILKGEYRDWANVILRGVNLEKFPLKWATLLGLENECIFFSDHDRQHAPPP